MWAAQDTFRVQHQVPHTWLFPPSALKLSSDAPHWGFLILSCSPMILHIHLFFPPSEAPHIAPAAPLCALLVWKCASTNFAKVVDFRVSSPRWGGVQDLVCKKNIWFSKYKIGYTFERPLPCPCHMGLRNVQNQALKFSFPNACSLWLAKWLCLRIILWPPPLPIVPFIRQGLSHFGLRCVVELWKTK